MLRPLRWLAILFGALLLIVGLATFWLPIPMGLPSLLLGLLLLVRYSTRARKVLARLMLRFPSLHRLLQRRKALRGFSLTALRAKIRESRAATIEITHPHGMARERAKQRLDDLAVRLQPRFDVDYHWEGDTLLFVRRGASGEVSVDAESVRVFVRLAAMLRRFEDRIRNDIEDQLSRGFSE